MVRFKLDPANPPLFTPEELARVDAKTEAEVFAAAAGDADNPPSTVEELERASFAREVRLAREALGMSEAAFAAVLALPIATLRDWERGQIAPDPAARALIRIILREPEAALRALAA